MKIFKKNKIYYFLMSIDKTLAVYKIQNSFRLYRCITPLHI